MPIKGHKVICWIGGEEVELGHESSEGIKSWTKPKPVSNCHRCVLGDHSRCPTNLPPLEPELIEQACRRLGVRRPVVWRPGESYGGFWTDFRTGLTWLELQIGWCNAGDWFTAIHELAHAAGWSSGDYLPSSHLTRLEVANEEVMAAEAARLVSSPFFRHLHNEYHETWLRITWGAKPASNARVRALAEAVSDFPNEVVDISNLTLQTT